MIPSSNKIYLIDGNAYIHRAYHALPPLTTSSGMLINAVYGFVRMVFKVLKNFKPEYICVCFDSAKPTFRHTIYKEYKATRKEIEEDLKLQFPVVFEFVQLSGIPYFVVEGYEADDVISSIVEKLKDKYEIVIISGDKDMLQLVSDKVLVYNEHKNIWYNINAVKEKYGVEPKMLVDFFSLVGDKIDNVPGITGIGPKTAAELLTKYGSIEGIYNNLDKFSPELRERFVAHKEELLKSRELIKLNTKIEQLESFTIDNIKLQKLNLQKIKEFLLKYEMRSIIAELDKLSKIVHQDEGLLFDTVEKSFIADVEETEIFYAAENNIDVLNKIIRNSSYIVSSIISIGDKIIGCVGVNNEKYKFYIPAVSHKRLNNSTLEPLQQRTFLGFINRLFFSGEVEVVTYNIKSQLKKISKVSTPKNKFKLDKIYDVLLLYYLVDPNKRVKSLQELVDLILGGKIVSEIELPVDMNLNLFPVDKLALRLTDTMEVIYECYLKIKDRINQYSLMDVYKKLDLPLVDVLIKMENNGILVDKLYAESLKQNIQKDISEIKEKIYKIAGLEFNLNSPKQLSFILFEKLKLPPVKKKKTGYSTDEEVLQKLKEVHPIIPLLLQYRELEKLKNTYIEPLESHINPTTNRIHTVFNLVGTATGRLSSEEPNMQNIPVKTELGKKIRQIFVAPQNYKLVSLDYSQIELRILAHFSKDETLVTAFMNNKDIHSSTACEIFGINEEDVDETYRRTAKVINFGIIYGITPQGLAKELNVPVELAADYIKKYFDKYKGVKKWIDETIKFAKLNGYVKTLFGRIRPIPEINSTNKQLVSFGERLAVNSPIQGTAADIIKLAMIKIDEYIENENLTEKVKMLLQIHDELLFEIHEDVLSQTVEQIKNIMEKVVELEVPIVVDVSIFNRWGES